MAKARYIFNPLFSTIAPIARVGARLDGSVAHLPLSMAFQPIVDVSRRGIFAYEALVRGVEQESASDVLRSVTLESRAAFDQSCRIKAMILARELGVTDQGALLAINFLPGAAFSPTACIQRTLRAAQETGFPLSSLMFEINEMETVNETARLQAVASEYRKHGLTLALDDFGAGHSGLNLLADLDIHVLKLDGHLIQGIDRNPRANEIVQSTAAMCRRLNVQVVAECVETREEYEVLRNAGITLMQGYFFAKPTFEALPEIIWPEDRGSRPAVSSIGEPAPALLPLRFSSVA